jgi:hypothetical protein
MNKGGRPLGSASLQKRIEDQKRDEEEHPEKRDQKHEQRLNFFTPGFFVRRTPVQSMKPHGGEGGIDRALESEGRRDYGPPLSEIRHKNIYVPAIVREVWGHIVDTVCGGWHGKPEGGRVRRANLGHQFATRPAACGSGGGTCYSKSQFFPTSTHELH